MEEMIFETNNSYYVALNEENRITMVTSTKQNDDMFLFDFPLDFDITQHINYKIENGELVHDEFVYPEIEPVTPLEDRVTTLEEENSLLTECVLEMSSIIYGE